MYETILGTSSRTFLAVKEISDLMNIFDFDYTITSAGITKTQLEELFLYTYGERQTNQATAIAWYRVFKASWLKNLFKYNEIFTAYFNASKFDSTNITEAITTDTDGSSEFIEPAIDGEEGTPSSKNNNEASSTVARTATGRNGLSFIEDIKKLLELGNPVEEFLSSVAQDTLLHNIS